MRSTIFTFPSRLASPRSVLVFSDEVVVSVGVVVVVVGSVSVGVVVVVVGSVSVGSVVAVVVVVSVGVGGTTGVVLSKSAPRLANFEESFNCINP